MHHPRQRIRKPIHWKATIAILGGLAVLVVATVWVALYASQRTTIIEVLAIVNPPGPAAGDVNLTQTGTLGGLQPVPLEVPAAFSNGTFAQERTLNVPRGFRVSVYATNTPGARFMALNSEGVTLVSLMKSGKVVALPDRNRDGVADEVITFADGLNLPHGLAFREGWLYVAENHQVVRFRDENGDLRADGAGEVVVPNLPSGGGHVTRTLAFDRTGQLYVSVGSSCNVCVDQEHRAAILKYGSNGENETLYATGLRNSVGLVLNQPSGELWATDNGRDFLGDNLPPEEVNKIVQDGNYGWPYCYGDNTVDPEYNQPQRCVNARPPVVKMQAHSAPLGLRFYSGSQFPTEYRDQLFVAFHGSWNRREPTGYKVVMIGNLRTAPQVVDFVTGWLEAGKAWGRPVDIIVAADGSLLVSDDHAGAIYRIFYP